MDQETKESKETDKAEAASEDPLDAEAKGYKALKTPRWKPAGTQDDPNAPVLLI